MVESDSVLGESVWEESVGRAGGESWWRELVEGVGGDIWWIEG